jgi:hypothetical protein
MTKRVILPPKKNKPFSVSEKSPRPYSGIGSSLRPAVNKASTSLWIKGTLLRCRKDASSPYCNFVTGDVFEVVNLRTLPSSAFSELFLRNVGSGSKCFLRFPTNAISQWELVFEKIKP